MRFLLINGPDLIDHALRLLEVGHEVIFLHVIGGETPFSYNVNFANLPRKNWTDHINCFADTHNTYEEYRHLYQEHSYSDLDAIYGDLDNLQKEHSPDHVIRAASDFAGLDIDFDFIC